MTTYTRKNAWNNQGTFSNPELLWYAKAVGEMQSRSLDDPTSWWFFATMHGQYITKDADSGAPPPEGYPNWATIPGVPHVPTTPLPAESVMKKYWDQCQHYTWFFAPWHRGYLYAIENVLRNIIQDLGGPNDWALPYWNYFGPQDEYKIPPAFTQENLPDGKPNPLFVTARYGPKANRNIYVDVSKVSQNCQSNPDYSGSAPNHYGGGKTGFMHFGDIAGALEYNPHNGVHGMIGGKLSSIDQGLMSDPGTAALDPIFYLHHCNIDRMWAAWNADGKKNPTDASWLNGPTATNNRKFYAPKPDKTAWEFTPAMVKDIALLNYTYFDLSSGVPASLVDKNILRLRNFGLPIDKIKTPIEMKLDANTELIGANASSVVLDATGARTTVTLDTAGWNTVTKSIKNTFSASLDDNTKLPDEVYLELEGITGNADANIYSVTVNQHFVGHIFLFGLMKASMKDSAHGGQGLTIVFNITKVIDKLHLNNAFNLNTLDVLIQPDSPTFEDDKCIIGRVRIYRKGQS